MANGFARLTQAFICWLIIGPGLALAQTPLPTPTVILASSGNLKEGHLYAIETHCDPGGPIPSSGQPDFFKRFLGSEKQTLTHFVAISTNGVTGPIDLAKLPTSVVQLTFAFSTDGNGTPVNNIPTCGQSTLIVAPPIQPHARSALSIVPVLAATRTPQSGAIGTIFKLAAQTFTSLSPVFTGHTLSSNTTKNLSDLESADQPLAQLFQIFTPSAVSNPINAFPLYIGTSTVKTPYSIVYIKTREIGSIVGDNKNRVYLQDLIKQVDGSGTKIDSANPAAGCEQVGNLIGNAGFTSIADKAFSVGRVAIKNLSSKDQVAQCLGANWCATAIHLDDTLWRGVDPAIKPTDTDCKGLSPPELGNPTQPSFAQVAGYLVNLMRVLGQYVKSSPAPPGIASQLSTYFGKDLSVEDRTTNATFIASAPPKGFPAVIDYLVSKEYRHFGCYVQVTDAGLSGAYGAVVMFLGAKGASTATSAQITDTIALYPIFSDKQISDLKVSDNLDEIRKVTAQMQKGCNGFKINDP